jgi:hypothetical protein
MIARLRHWSALAVVAGLSACTGSIDDNGSGAAGGGTPTPGNSGPNANPGSPGNPTIPSAPGVERPGRTPVRRLTHLEYNNTIRDLLGLNEDFAGAFAGDEEAGGFAANTVSPVSEALADQYHAAAEGIAAKAVAAGLNQLAPCAGGASPDSCAQDFVRNFGRRAFRRPLSNDELARYKQVYTTGANGADHAAGVALVLTAMLQSPNFLYLPEHGNKQAAEKDGLPLDPYETAARLSYFLTSSTPDAALSAAADQGALRTPEQVAAQARRLLSGPQARDSIISFYQQLLEMPNLATVDKDPKLFPQYTPAVRAAMADELAAFASRVTLEGDGKLETLFSAGFSYPAAALAPIYGLPDAAGANGTAQVTLPKGQRAGLLTLPAVMAVYAQTDQTRPVGRGFLVADKLLCNTPPPAPDNVPMLPPPAPNVTTRERLEKHRSDPSCAACHALFDPFGLTFEIYDPIGRYRSSEGNKPVDATGKGLPNGFADVKDATELLPQLAKSDVVRDCLVRQWFRFALGRDDGKDDQATLSAARGAFARADFAVRDLLVGLVTTRGFRYRALPQP